MFGQQASERSHAWSERFWPTKMIPGRGTSSDVWSSGHRPCPGEQALPRRHALLHFALRDLLLFCKQPLSHHTRMLSVCPSSRPCPCERPPSTLVAIEPAWRTGCVITAAPSFPSHCELFCFFARGFRMPLQAHFSTSFSCRKLAPAQSVQVECTGCILMALLP